MAFGRERVKASEGLFPFIRRRVAFPHSWRGLCTEWWPGGGQSHSQPCLGAGRAAQVAPAVGGDRSPQSHFAARGTCEHSQLTLCAQGGNVSPRPRCDSRFLCLQTAAPSSRHHHPRLSQSRKMVSNLPKV